MRANPSVRGGKSCSEVILQCLGGVLSNAVAQHYFSNGIKFFYCVDLKKSIYCSMRKLMR